MPWLIKKNDSGQFCIHKKDADGNPTGSSLGCHDTPEKAQAQIKALYANVKSSTRYPHQAIKESAQFGVMREAEGEVRGDVWPITVLKFGKSARVPHFVYTREAVTASLAIFDGAKLYGLSSPDDYGHAKDSAKKPPKEIVGIITDPVITDVGLNATLHILPSGKWLKENLIFAQDNNLPFPYELSIDANGDAEQADFEGEMLPVVKNFGYVAVDVVERGAAGGQIVKLAASMSTNSLLGGDVKMKDKAMFLFSLCWPAFLASKNVNLAEVEETELLMHLREANKATPRIDLPDNVAIDEKLLDEQITKLREAIGKSDLKEYLDKLDAVLKAAAIVAPTPVEPTSDEKGAALAIETAVKASLEPMKKEMEAMKLKASQAILSQKLIESKLPKDLQDHVRTQFEGKTFEEKELDAQIESTRKVYGRLVASTPNNRGFDVRAGMDEVDKIKLGLDGFFLKGAIKPLTAEEAKEMLKGVPAYRSIKASYIDYTGDVDVTGLKNKSTRFTESLVTGDWAEVMASAMNKRLVRDYNALELNASWQQLGVDVVSVTDFKPNLRIRTGGYPNLPAVAQRAPYLPLASPTDEQATYTATKRGGTEDYTLESIKNDDVGALSRIPQRMARAAAQTLHEFVFNFIFPIITTESVGTPNLIYDGTALYTTAHANKGTAALASDAVAFRAARLRMRKQTMKDNAKPLGLRTGFLIVPPDLEAVAYELTMPAAGNANLVPKFEQSFGIKPIVVDYWAATDLTDWALAAKKEEGAGIEIGFLDGQENPEIVVSDIPNSGSWFTNDVVTLRIRHIYSGAVLDHRFFDGSNVA